MALRPLGRVRSRVDSPFGTLAGRLAAAGLLAGAPPIEITVTSWQEVDGLRFVDSFTLRQGDEDFTYDAVSIRPDAVDPRLFDRTGTP